MSAKIAPEVHAQDSTKGVEFDVGVANGMDNLEPLSYDEKMYAFGGQDRDEENGQESLSSENDTSKSPSPSKDGTTHITSIDDVVPECSNKPYGTDKTISVKKGSVELIGYNGEVIKAKDHDNEGRYVLGRTTTKDKTFYYLSRRRHAHKQRKAQELEDLALRHGFEKLPWAPPRHKDSKKNLKPSPRDILIQKYKQRMNRVECKSCASLSVFKDHGLPVVEEDSAVGFYFVVPTKNNGKQKKGLSFYIIFESEQAATVAYHYFSQFKIRMKDSKDSVDTITDVFKVFLAPDL